MYCIILFFAYLCVEIVVYGNRKYRIANAQRVAGTVYPGHHQETTGSLPERYTGTVERSKAGSFGRHIIPFAYPPQKCRNAELQVGGIDIRPAKEILHTYQ